MTTASTIPNIGALQGIKVLDLSRILGGPLCGQILGDHGADVLKVFGQYHLDEATNDELLLRRLAPFLAAGLRAPIPAEDDGYHLYHEA